MSLLKKAFKIAKKVLPKAAGFIPGPIGTGMKVLGGAASLGGIATVGRAVVAGSRSLPALPGVVRSVPGIGKIAKVAGTAATGAAVYDAAGNFLGTRKRRRRINPLNHRALSRALKRVEKVKSTMKRVNAITIRKAKEC